MLEIESGFDAQKAWSDYLIQIKSHTENLRQWAIENKQAHWGAFAEKIATYTAGMTMELRSQVNDDEYAELEREQKSFQSHWKITRWLVLAFTRKTGRMVGFYHYLCVENACAQLCESSTPNAELLNNFKAALTTAEKQLSVGSTTRKRLKIFWNAIKKSTLDIQARLFEQDSASINPDKKKNKKQSFFRGGIKKLFNFPNSRDSLSQQYPELTKPLLAKTSTQVSDDPENIFKQDAKNLEQFSQGARIALWDQWYPKKETFIEKAGGFLKTISQQRKDFMLNKYHPDKTKNTPLAPYCGQIQEKLNNTKDEILSELKILVSLNEAEYEERKKQRINELSAKEAAHPENQVANKKTTTTSEEEDRRINHLIDECECVWEEEFEQLEAEIKKYIEVQVKKVLRREIDKMTNQGAPQKVETTNSGSVSKSGMFANLEEIKNTPSLNC